jgi:hypothetical protein
MKENIMSGVSPDGTATWIGIVAAASVGVVGWIFAGIANGRAKKANELAEKANGIAEMAIVRADDANGIAEHANKLSEQANSLIERTTAQKDEDWFVDWTAKWNHDSALIVLRNTGRDAARNLSVTIDGEKLHRVVEFDHDILGGTDDTISLSEIVQKRTDNAAAMERIIQSNRASSVSVIPSPLNVNITLSLRWQTGRDVWQPKELTLRIY